MYSGSPNSVRLRPLSQVKNAVLKGGRRSLAVRAGLLRGIVLDLDLRHDTQVYLGLYERETFRFIRRSAAECAWMIDVGAGNGELAIYFLRQRHCEIVHAFEPRPGALARLRGNLALNGLADDRRLVAHQGFAGTGIGPDRMSIDSLGVDAGKPGFLKIDVDGAETNVLDSARALLAAGRAAVLVEVHSEQLEHDCVARLRGFGYATGIVDNAWWRLLVPERRPIAHNRWIWGTKPS